MSFGSGLFSVDPFSAGSEGGGGADVYTPAASLSIAITAGSIVATRLYLRVRITEKYSPVCPLSIAVRHPRVVLGAPLQIAVYERVALVLPLSITMSEQHRAPVVGSDPEIWSVRVMLDGVDVSARVTGEVHVEAAEGAARVATIALAPGRVFAAMDELLRKPVVVDYEQWKGAVRVGQYRLFTGLVDSPEYDSGTHVLTLTCTDARQAKIMAMTRSQIDALTPLSSWSPHIFDRYAGSEQYMDDRLSTVAGSVDCDALGVLTFAPWSGVPSRTFTDDVILDGTLRPTVVAAAGIRRTRLTVTYRYTQAVVRCIAFAYQSPSLGDQFFLGLRALTRTAVEQALGSCGATVEGGINWTPYPAAAAIEHVGAILAANPSALCLGAAAWLNRRYSRTVREIYVVEIGSEGTLSEETRTIAVEWDPTQNNTYRLPQGAVTAFATAQKDQPIPYIPARNAAGETIVTYVPPGEPDATDFATAYAVAIRVAARKVVDSRRGAVIDFQVPLDPTVTLQDFVAVDSSAVTGAGKVTRVTHRLNVEAGSAVTTVGVETVSATLPDPLPADRPTVPAVIKPGALAATAQTWIGGQATSPPWDETTMFGWSGNVMSPYAIDPAKVYPEQFSVMVPGIEPQAAGLITAPPTCTTTAGVATISALSSFDGLEPGIKISGAGIPPNTIVISISGSNRTATLNKAATASGVLVEIRVESRQYLSPRRISYTPTINRTGPIIGA